MRAPMSSPHPPQLGLIECKQPPRCPQRRLQKVAVRVSMDDVAYAYSQEPLVMNLMQAKGTGALAFSL